MHGGAAYVHCTLRARAVPCGGDVNVHGVCYDLVRHHDVAQAHIFCEERGDDHARGRAAQHECDVRDNGTFQCMRYAFSTSMQHCMRVHHVNAA
eukprot:2452661-Pleurochrysis_carterae.AAC.4